MSLPKLLACTPHTQLLSAIWCRSSNRAKHSKHSRFSIRERQFTVLQGFLGDTREQDAFVRKLWGQMQQSLTGKAPKIGAVTEMIRRACRELKNELPAPDVHTYYLCDGFVWRNPDLNQLLVFNTFTIDRCNSTSRVASICFQRVAHQLKWCESMLYHDASIQDRLLRM